MPLQQARLRTQWAFALLFVSLRALCLSSPVGLSIRSLSCLEQLLECENKLAPGSHEVGGAQMAWSTRFGKLVLDSFENNAHAWIEHAERGNAGHEAVMRLWVCQVFAACCDQIHSEMHVSASRVRLSVFLF